MRPMAAPPPPQRNQAPQDIDIHQSVIGNSRCAGISAAPADKPAKYELINLTRCQKAAGFWEDLETVKSLAGVNVDKIDNVDLSDKSMERKCVATIIAIATMRVKSSNEKNSWIMIEQKALAWLKKNLPDADIEQVISKVRLSYVQLFFFFFLNVNIFLINNIIEQENIGGKNKFFWTG